MADIGYIRVSTTQQHTDRQLADVQLDKVFEDKASGKNTDRPEFKKLMEYVREGDIIHVHSIDRLARSLPDLRRLIDDWKDHGISVKFHKEGLIFDADNGNAISTLMFSMLGAFAEFERKMMLERQADGYQAARAAGRVPGRGKGRSIDRVGIKAALAAGCSVRSVAAQFEVSTRTVQNVKGEA